MQEFCDKLGTVIKHKEASIVLKKLEYDHKLKRLVGNKTQLLRNE